MKYSNILEWKAEASQETSHTRTKGIHLFTPFPVYFVPKAASKMVSMDRKFDNKTTLCQETTKQLKRELETARRSFHLKCNVSMGLRFWTLLHGAFCETTWPTSIGSWQGHVLFCTFCVWNNFEEQQQPWFNQISGKQRPCKTKILPPQWITNALQGRSLSVESYSQFFSLIGMQTRRYCKTNFTCTFYGYNHVVFYRSIGWSGGTGSAHWRRGTGPVCWISPGTSSSQDGWPFDVQERVINGGSWLSRWPTLGILRWQTERRSGWPCFVQRSSWRHTQRWSLRLAAVLKNAKWRSPFFLPFHVLLAGWLCSLKYNSLSVMPCKFPQWVQPVFFLIKLQLEFVTWVTQEAASHHISVNFPSSHFSWQNITQNSKFPSDDPTVYSSCQIVVTSQRKKSSVMEKQLRLKCVPNEVWPWIHRSLLEVRVRPPLWETIRVMQPVSSSNWSNTMQVITIIKGTSRFFPWEHPDGYFIWNLPNSQLSWVVIGSYTLPITRCSSRKAHQVRSVPAEFTGNSELHCGRRIITMYLTLSTPGEKIEKRQCLINPPQLSSFVSGIADTYLNTDLFMENDTERFQCQIITSVCKLPRRATCAGFTIPFPKTVRISSN